MITTQLLRPESIVVVGASNNVHKPGGAILKNLINGGYQGDVYKRQMRMWKPYIYGAETKNGKFLNPNQIEFSVKICNRTDVYKRQDHQGNNRVVVDEEGTVEEVNHYYPFGGVRCV